MNFSCRREPRPREAREQLPRLHSRVFFIYILFLLSPPIPTLVLHHSTLLPPSAFRSLLLPPSSPRSLLLGSFPPSYDLGCPPPSSSLARETWASERQRKFNLERPRRGKTEVNRGADRGNAKIKL